MIYLFLKFLQRLADILLQKLGAQHVPEIRNKIDQILGVGVGINALSDQFQQPAECRMTRVRLAHRSVTFMNLYIHATQS